MEVVPGLGQELFSGSGTGDQKDLEDDSGIKGVGKRNTLIARWALLGSFFGFSFQLRFDVFQRFIQRIQFLLQPFNGFFQLMEGTWQFWVGAVGKVHGKEGGLNKECQIGSSEPKLAPINRETRPAGTRHLDKKEIIKTVKFLFYFK